MELPSFLMIIFSNNIFFMYERTIVYNDVCVRFWVDIYINYSFIWVPNERFETVQRSTFYMFTYIIMYVKVRASTYVYTDKAIHT